MKSVKNSIKVAIGTQRLSFTEIQTFMFSSANVVNGRQIGHPTSTEDGKYLSPNDLLLGRSTNVIPHGEYDTACNVVRRFQFLQQLIDRFWKKWTRDYFPSLIIRHKWHSARRNLKVGDVVIIQDNNQMRGKWKMGIVERAEKSLRDGFVRNVEVKYKNVGAKTFTTVTRPVQRLIVLLPVEEQ